MRNTANEDYRKMIEQTDAEYEQMLAEVDAEYEAMLNEFEDKPQGESDATVGGSTQVRH